MSHIIISTTNPKIKWVKSLHKNSVRRNEGVFVIEGAKEIATALDNGFEPQYFFVCKEIYGQELPLIDVEDLYIVSKEVFEKISYRSSSDGLLAVCKTKQKTLAELNFSDNPFFIVIESVEKPGNLGAIIRTADGVGADGVIVCSERTDVFNPNVIRSSVGTVFNQQVVSASNEEVYDFLQNHEITPFGAIISKESLPYFKADLTRPTAIILGTEHEGLGKYWQQRTSALMIPMLGSNDSLNVSAAAAILAYEVLRQRLIDKISIGN
jgi:TrmH family RNA methyltransferase